MFIGNEFFFYSLLHVLVKHALIIIVMLWCQCKFGDFGSIWRGQTDNNQWTALYIGKSPPHNNCKVFIANGELVQKIGWRSVFSVVANS